MSFFRSASALTGALVHPSAQQRSPAGRIAHETFIAEKLAVTAVTLAAAPFLLVYHGVPSLAEAVVFALALGQIGAAMVVVRTGHLLLGHLISIGSILGMAVALAIGSGVFAAALAWLIVVVIEAVSSFDKRVLASGSIGVSAALALMVLSGWDSAIGNEALVMLAAAVLMALLMACRVDAVISTDRSSAERDRARALALFGVLGDLVVAFDHQGLVHQVSGDLGGLLGTSDGALGGRGLFEQVHVADRPVFLKLVADAIHVGGEHVGEVRLRSAVTHANAASNTEPTHVRVEMRTCRLGLSQEVQEGLAGAVAVLRDVTAQRLSAGEADIPANDIPAASKREFLASMSHELRTPLNAIIGFSEMLASQTLRPVEQDKQREYARIIHQSGQHLLGVVDSILDMSKIQSGTFSLLPEPFEVAPLIEQCCDIVRLRAEAGGVELLRDMPTGLPDIVGDRRTCKQILINLLSNAVKFTPDLGRVTIALRLETDALSICVTDTGIGISPADLSKLGDPFFQVRSATARPPEGTGLGLSVVRGLIDLHRGSFVITSELGKGTKATVRLPLDYRLLRDVDEEEVPVQPPTGLDRPAASARFSRVQHCPELRMKQIA